jgi:hypothetical protein
MTHFSGRC